MGYEAHEAHESKEWLYDRAWAKEESAGRISEMSGWTIEWQSSCPTWATGRS